VSELQDLVDRSALVRELRAPLGEDATWLVGGSVRDLLLGRGLEDVDLVVAADVRRAAKSIAAAKRAHAFPLSEQFGAWRVVSPDQSWQADLTSLRAGTIEADLALRDFTVNAIAVALQADGDRMAGEVVDPHDGLSDVRSRVLRVVGDSAYADDPLRTLRLARFASELDFAVDSAALRGASRYAAQIASVAPERIYYELRRTITSDDPLRGLELMDEVGLVKLLLPELERLKGVEQNRYHQFDVWGHSHEVLRRLLDVEREPQRALGALGPQIAAELGRPFADEMTRGQALRFAALLHDIGKPQTRSVSAEGKVLFLGHDELGAQMCADICRRLHASSALGDYLAALARCHLKLGFLVRERPLTRSHVYQYMRACEPVEVEVTFLSVADRLATRGPKTKASAIEGHLELARELMAAALEWRAHGPPRPPIGGEEIMDELGLESGPELGRLLERLREATYVGEISTRDEALRLARRLQTPIKPDCHNDDA
jgi:poly(A) polymerase